MVMGGLKAARTPERSESDRHERNAWLFAAVMVAGCSIPIGAAIMFRSPTRAPMILDAAATPAPSHAGSAHPVH